MQVSNRFGVVVRDVAAVQDAKHWPNRELSSEGKKITFSKEKISQAISQDKFSNDTTTQAGSKGENMLK